MSTSTSSTKRTSRPSSSTTTTRSCDVDEEVLVADPAVEVDDEPAPRGRKKAAGDDEVEDDDEVADPDDVEADLDAILKVASRPPTTTRTRTRPRSSTRTLPRRPTA